MKKIDLLYKNVGSNDSDKAWRKYITHGYYGWSHALVLCRSGMAHWFEMCASTSFRSIYLTVSTLAEGESSRLAPLAILREAY